MLRILEIRLVPFKKPLRTNKCQLIWSTHLDVPFNLGTLTELLVTNISFYKLGDLHDFDAPVLAYERALSRAHKHFWLKSRLRKIFFTLKNIF